MSTILALFLWVVFGFIAGIIARAVLPGNHSMTYIQTIVLGIIGSLAGGFIVALFEGGDLLRPSGILMSILGAVLVLLFVGTSTRSRLPRV